MEKLSIKLQKRLLSRKPKIWIFYVFFLFYQNVHGQIRKIKMENAHIKFKFKFFLSDKSFNCSKSFSFQIPWHWPGGGGGEGGGALARGKSCHWLLASFVKDNKDCTTKPCLASVPQTVCSRAGSPRSRTGCWGTSPSAPVVQNTHNKN